MQYPNRKRTWAPKVVSNKKPKLVSVPVKRYYRGTKRNYFVKKKYGYKFKKKEQVSELTWGTPTQPMVIDGNAPTIMHQNPFPRGGDENKRHTDVTYINTAIMKIHMRLPDDQAQKAVANIPVWFWLVYDRAPTGSLPAGSDIVQSKFADLPSLWFPNRGNSDRFKVLRKWCVNMSSNGLTFGGQPSRGTYVMPARNGVTVTKVFKNLGIRTEWKNYADTGDLGDIKSGALYVYMVPSYQYKINVYAQNRLYFRSV